MLVGYDYNSEEEGDYLPDDSIVIEKPSTIASTTAMSSTAPTVKKQSLIGLAATTSKLSKLDSAVEVENAANRKRVKLFSTSSKLHEILPAPKNEAKVTPDMLAAEVKAKKVQQEMEEENLNESSSEDSNVREEKQSNVSVNNNSSNIAQYEESSDIDSDEEERRLEALIQLQKQQAQEKKQQPPPEVPHLTAVAKPVQPPNPSAPIQYVMPAKQAQVQNSILAQIQAQKQQQAQQQAQQNQLHPSFAMQKQLPPEQLQQLQNQQRLQWQQQQQQMQAPQFPQNFQPPSIQPPLLLQQVQQQQQQFLAPQPVYEQPSLLHQQPAAVADDVPDADAAILGPMRPAEESWGEYDYAPMPGAEPQEYDSAAYYAEQDRLMNQEIQSKRWGEMNKIDSSQVIQIRATDIHNGQYTRTELAHKERLEKMSVNMHKQISSRRGQLSVIAMEAERQSLQDEERRAAQKQMRRETRQRYGW